MSKHHHQSRAEQIDNKIHGTVTFHQHKMFDHAAVELRAYQTYQEKGGSDLDNWLEAERALMEDAQAVSSIISEGDPNTQRETTSRQ